MALASSLSLFVGREDELTQISVLFADPACRLLTLVGPGGIGKTRLALDVAARHADAYSDGVAFIELASISTPNQIVSTVGEAINLFFSGHTDPTSSLLGYLRDKQMLLVLDEFEHL